MFENVGVRVKVDLAGHSLFPAYDLRTLAEPINNVVVGAPSDGRWNYGVTSRFGEWHAHVRSCYIRWAISINGLNIASEKYSNRDWQSSKAFVVSSFDNGTRVQLARWEGGKAS